MVISLGEFLYPWYDQIQIEWIAGRRRLSIVCFSSQRRVLLIHMS